VEPLVSTWPHRRRQHEALQPPAARRARRRYLWYQHGARRASPFEVAVTRLRLECLAARATSGKAATSFSRSLLRLDQDASRSTPAASTELGSRGCHPRSDANSFVACANLDVEHRFSQSVWFSRIHVEHNWASPRRHEEDSLSAPRPPPGLCEQASRRVTNSPSALREPHLFPAASPRTEPVTRTTWVEVLGVASACIAAKHPSV